MLVLSRKPAERIFFKPHKLAEQGLARARRAALLVSYTGDTEALEEIRQVAAILEQLAGDAVIVNVVRIGPSQVKLGVEADRGRDILREELLETPPTQTEAAA